MKSFAEKSYCYSRLESGCNAQNIKTFKNKKLSPIELIELNVIEVVWPGL